MVVAPPVSARLLPSSTPCREEGASSGRSSRGSDRWVGRRGEEVYEVGYIMMVGKSDKAVTKIIIVRLAGVGREANPEEEETRGLIYEQVGFPGEGEVEQVR